MKATNIRLVTIKPSNKNVFQGKNIYLKQISSCHTLLKVILTFALCFQPYQILTGLKSKNRFSPLQNSLLILIHYLAYQMKWDKIDAGFL